MAKKADDVSVGTLVEHPARPQWGPGRVVALSEGGRVHVFFRDDLQQRAKVILTEVITLKVCATQEDEVLDGLPPAKFDGQHWVLPKPKATPSRKRAAAAAAAAGGS